MSLWKIAWRSIQQRALASSLTALSVALGVALVVAVLVAQKVIRDSFTRGASGYHLVVGKKGSQLQLVLNTVYHLQDPIENIPYSYYKRLTNPKDELGRKVQVAIPYCLGDNYQGFRVVGTIPDLFTKLEYADGQKYEFESGGRNFKANKFFEAVIGSAVARATELKVGEEFQPVHGLSDEGDGHKHDKFKVVGILKPTGTANDRALFINIEGFYLLDNHAKPLEEGAVATAGAAKPAAHEAGHDHPHDGHDEHDHAAHDHAKPDAEAAHEPADHDHSAHDHDEHDHANDAKAPAAKAAAHDEQAPHDEAGHDEPGHEHAEPASKGPAEVKPGEPDHDHAAHDDHDHAGHNHPAGEGDDHDAHEGHDHNAHDHDGHDHEGHDHAGHSHSHEPLPEDQREVTAVLVLAKGGPALADLAAGDLRKLINKGDEAQAAAPVRVIADFFQKIVQQITIALLALTVLIIVVSGIGVMVSIYNSMNDRRRDIAVMRALGAARGTVLSVILVESILLSLGGGVLGVLLGHALVGILGPTVEQLAGVSLGFFQFDKYELVLIPGLVLLASLMGYLPALSAYRTDVAKALSASP